MKPLVVELLMICHKNLVAILHVLPLVIFQAQGTFLLLEIQRLGLLIKKMQTAKVFLLMFLMLLGAWVVQILAHKAHCMIKCSKQRKLREQEQEMEINKVGDLIPYHKSLKELWDKEEFQPVLGLLSSLKEEAIVGLRVLDLKLSAEEVKTHAAILKTQLNLANMFLQLPAVVKEVEQNIEAQKNKVVAFKNSQEGGEL